MNEIVREEIKERFYVSSNGEKYSRGIVKYSRRNKIGEGFGKRKVGMKVLVVKEYLYEEIESWNSINGKGMYKINVGEIKEKGIIIRIVRRINRGYYDYWYKVKLENGKYKWSSYVELIK